VTTTPFSDGPPDVAIILADGCFKAAFMATKILDANADVTLWIFNYSKL
jgi:hypothetical protein